MTIDNLPLHPYTSRDVDLHSAHTEAIGEALKIEAEHTAHPEWVPLTPEEAWHGCEDALGQARDAWGTPEQHRYLVRLAGWALVALRAEVPR